MKAITVLQPWAWAIATGLKTIENRSWPTSYRGPLAIHAGASERMLACSQPTDWHGVLPGLPAFDTLDYGAIVATCVLLDVLTIDQVRAIKPAARYAEGPYCWILAGTLRLGRPVPCRGRLSLYDLPDELIPEHARNSAALAAETAIPAWRLRRAELLESGPTLRVGTNYDAEHRATLETQ